MRTILVDVDDVLNNLLTGWVQRYNKEYNDTLTADSFLDWNMLKFIKQECGEKIYDYLKDPTLYEECTPTPHSQEVIERLLKHGDRIYVVSSCVPESVDAKFSWVLKHYPLKWNQCIACSNKGLIIGDYLIGDGLHNAVGFTGTFLLMDRAHNRSDTTLRRVKDWYEVESILFPGDRC